MNTTAAQLQRTSKDWSNYAGEPVSVEQIGGALYAFCSELAALRIEHKYRNSGDAAKADYSANKGSWFFRLEF